MLEKIAGLAAFDDVLLHCHHGHYTIIENTPDFSLQKRIVELYDYMLAYDDQSVISEGRRFLPPRLNMTSADLLCMCMYVYFGTCLTIQNGEIVK